MASRILNWLSSNVNLFFNGHLCFVFVLIIKLGTCYLPLSVFVLWKTNILLISKHLNLNYMSNNYTTKTYVKRDDFHSYRLLSILSWWYTLSLSYGVYVSQLVLFAHVCNNVLLDLSENILYLSCWLFMMLKSQFIT